MIRVCLIGDKNDYLTKMDEPCLKENFGVFSGYIDTHSNVEVLKQYLALKRPISDSDIVLVHGSDIHAFIALKLAKKFNKKVILAPTAFDVSCNHEMKYGLHINKPRSFIAKWVLRNVDHIIAYTYTNWGRIENYTKRPVTHLNGYVSPFKSERGLTVNLSKRNVVLTVADATINTYRVSGIQMYNLLAIQQPNFNFYAIGKTDRSVTRMYDRIKYLGDLSTDQKIDAIAKSKFYCQFSYIDDLNPNTIMAIQNECCVLYTSNSGLQDIVGSEGFACRYMDAYGAQLELSQANILYANDSEKRTRAAKRYIEGYSLTTHAKKLKDVIEKVYEE